MRVGKRMKNFGAMEKMGDVRSSISAAKKELYERVVVTLIT